jgi:ribosome-associated translation inhibitor RaiA
MSAFCEISLAMKLTLKHQSHQSSPSFAALIKERIGFLAKVLRIDEARTLVERRTESSPPFRLAAQLVTPGPDVFAEAADHTLRAALHKLVKQLKGRIEHRRQKRAKRLRESPLKALSGRAFAGAR